MSPRHGTTLTNELITCPASAWLGTTQRAGEPRRRSDAGVLPVGVAGSLCDYGRVGLTGMATAAASSTPRLAAAGLIAEHKLAVVPP